MTCALKSMNENVKYKLVRGDSGSSSYIACTNICFSSRALAIAQVNIFEKNINYPSHPQEAQSNIYKCLKMCEQIEIRPSKLVFSLGKFSIF